MLLAALEAVVDERVGLDPKDLDSQTRGALDADGLLGAGARERARAAVAVGAAGRRIEWASSTITQGDLLASFAAHCAEELDDVEVLERETIRLVARWRSETSVLELRNGFYGVDRLVSATPTMLIGDLEQHHLVGAFLDDPELRTRLCVFDPFRLEKIGTVRSSVFVYLEWFLRDTYGVKVLPANAFTQGLIERGIIHLGMG
jgi:hypothetical protein